MTWEMALLQALLFTILWLMLLNYLKIKEILKYKNSNESHNKDINNQLIQLPENIQKAVYDAVIKSCADIAHTIKDSISWGNDYD